MAISKEQLTVKVELDSKGVVTGIKNIGSSFKSANSQANATSKAFESAENALRDFAVATGGVAIAMSVINSNAIPKFISGLSKTGSATAQTITNLSLMSKELSTFAKMSSGLARDTGSSGILIIKNASDQAAPAIVNLANAFTKSFAQIKVAYNLTNAAQLSFLDQFRRMLPVVQYGASEISTAVKAFYGVFATAFSQQGISGLLREFSVNIATAFSVNNFQSAAGALGKSLVSLKAGIGEIGSATLAVAKDLPNSFGKIKDSFAAIPKITKDFFAFGKTIVSSHVGPTIIGLAESSLLLKGGLVALGTSLLSSDSAFGKLAGSATLVAGILLGGFAFAVKAAMAFVGDLISAIGDRLIASLTEMEVKFRKAETAITNFNFTIAGMNREFGDSAGTLQSWTAIVDELAEKTLITATDARSMAAEIMSVGKGLGLTKVQMEDLIRLIPNYVKAGDDAFGVTVSFLQALGGAPQGLLKYAVHLSDAGVEHSKFAKQSNLSMQALTEEQKVQARFNALMEQAIPIMGRANIQLKTVAGSQQYLAKTMLSVEEKIGKQSKIIPMLNIAFAKLTTEALKLPDALFYTVGVLQELGGIALKVVGTFISFAFPIAALGSLFAILNAAVATNATVQLVLSKALTVTNVALGGQAIAVTSASALWGGLATILKGVVVTSFSALVSSLASAGTAIWAFTTALLANPLFWKVAAIVGAIVAVVAALKRIEDETKIFSTLLNDILAPIKQFAAALSDSEGNVTSLSQVLSTVMRKAVSVAVIAVGGLVNGIFTLIFATSKLLDVLTFGKFQLFADSADYALDKMNKLADSMENAATDLHDFSSVAYAAAPSMDGLTQGAEQARNALSGLNKELMTGNERALIDAQAQGKQLEALLLSKVVAEDKMKLAKELSEKQNLTREIYQLDAQIAQFPVAAFQEASKSYNQLKIQNLEQLNTIASVRKAGALKAQEALAPLSQKISELKLLPSTESTKAALNQLKALYSATQQAINDDIIKKVKELKSAREDAELSAVMTFAQLIGDQGRLAEAQYQKDLKQYQQMLNDKLISEQEFEQAKAKLQEKKTTATEAPKIATTGTDPSKALGIIQSAASTADAVVSNAITMIGEQFGAEGKIIAAVVNLLRMGGDKLKELGAGIMQIVADLPVMLTEGAIGLIEGLVDGFVKLFGSPEAIDKFINSIIMALPKINRALTKGLISVMQILLDPAFWLQIAESIFNALVEAIVMAFDTIGDLFTGDWFGGMEKATEDMGKTVNEGIKYATNALTGVSDQMFGVMEDTATQAQRASGTGGGADTGKEMKKTQSWWSKWIVAPLKKVFGFFGEVIEVFFRPAILALQVAGELLGGIIRAVIEYFKMTWDLMMNVFTTTFNVIMSVFKGIWNTMMSILKGAFNAGVALWKGSLQLFKSIWDAAMGVFKSVIEFVKSIFQGIIDAFKAVFNFIVTLFDDPIQAFKNLWEDFKNIFANIWEKFEGIGDAIGEGISKIWKSIKEMFTKAGEAIWEGLKGAGDAIGQMFKDVGNNIWEGVKKGWNTIKDGFSSIGNYVWDGIKGAFNNIKSFFKGLFSFDGGGTGVVEDFLGFDFPWLAFAEGGKVPGSPKVMGDSAQNDTVAALLSPGEYVIPRSKTKDPANLMLIDAIMSGGKAAEWIQKTLLGGVEKKSSGGAIGQTKYGEWLSKASTGGIAFHLLGIPGTEAVPWGDDAVEGIKEGFKAVGDFLMPDWISDLWDSLKKFVSNIDLGKLVTDPLGAITDAIKGALNFLVEPFKKMMGFNAGGFVPGSGNFDSVPAMLTPGEFVINKNAAQALGGGLLNQLNAGRMPAAASQPSNFNITLNIETTQAIDETFVRQKLMPTIKQEIKSSSLRGEFLLSDKGVRR